ncbi:MULTISPECIES: hypothetical protein [Streptosporangium]|uniref:Uncharacterized protein n=1 Tax=Streptosporangium brasiliense TaxID=47480 RepID=A0ABT9R0G0_9ACTN|nr:hypothetical protein [Streptosporangium brasiliense]MDP9862416.1 hypothetical protein [Streptosporangium brasiliense]
MNTRRAAVPDPDVRYGGAALSPWHCPAADGMLSRPAGEVTARVAVAGAAGLLRSAR